MLLIILTGVLVLIFLLLKYIEGNEVYWKNQNIPCLTLKQIYNIINRYSFRFFIPIHERNLKLYSKFKKHRINRIGASVVFGHPFLFIMDPEITKGVLVKSFDHFVNRPNLLLNDPDWENMLFNKVNLEWRSLRHTMTPAFTSGKIRHMFDKIDSVSNKMVTYIKEQLGFQKSANDCIEISSICNKFTVECIAAIAFGINSQCFENETSLFAIHGQKLQHSITLWFNIRSLLAKAFPYLMKNFKYSLFDKTSIEFLKNVVRDNIHQRKRTGEKRNDFIQLLLEAQEENKIGLPDDIIIAQCTLFFVAGRSTIETLIMYAAYELALNSDVQDKLYSEIIQVMGEKGKFDYESTVNLEYLDMILSETLRKYPPLHQLDRMCNKEYAIPGTEWVIKKGTHVVFPVYSIHYDAEIYPEPQRFIPERFSSEQKAKRHLYSYLPFGLGPRACIGNRLALMEVKVAVSHLVYNFKLSPGSKTSIPIKYENEEILRPKDGLWLQLIPRIIKMD